MIHLRTVDDEKPVMGFFECFECDVVVLCFVFLVVKFELFGNGVGIDGHFYLRDFGKEYQRRLVDVVVYQNYRLFGTFDQVIDKHIRIKYLSVEEDALSVLQCIVFDT